MKNQKIEELLLRGVEEVIDRKSLESKLKNKKNLRVKLGVDPTSPNLHLGRSIPLLKLKDFQDLGHQIIFIIGDFTGLIGDTSDKDSERPMLSEEEVQKNLKTYINQASKIIDTEKAEIHYNSTWLGELNYKDIGLQADKFSINEFISRENIKKRLDEGKRVSLRETLYPLMQGYDSVAVKADVELGGTDQKFNLLAGRDMQRLYNQEPQDIVLGPLVEGLDGRKMSSSYGNAVNLTDEPGDMFGKIMSLKDDFIIKYFTLLTRVDLEKVKEYEQEMQSGANPKDLKVKLAYELVKTYHSEEEAKKAEESFTKTFSQNKFPDDAIVVKAKKDQALIDVLNSSDLKLSKTELRRLFKEGAVLDMTSNTKITDTHASVTSELKLKIGKKRFVKLEVN